MESYEFVVPGRVVSMQSANREAFRRWLDAIAVAAINAAPLVPPFWDPRVRLCIVFLCRPGPIDVDNVIKPIQDTLITIFYPDDDVVSDVECHRRIFSQPLHGDPLPELLRDPWKERVECTYVRLEETPILEEVP